MQVIGGLASRRRDGLAWSAWMWLVTLAGGGRVRWLSEFSTAARIRHERSQTADATSQARVASAFASGDAPGDAPAEARAAGQAPSAVFDTFYARHEQPLYGYLRRLLPTHEVAVEVAQETFFRAWRHFETVGAYDRPEAWLYRVATNLAISQMRHKAPLSFSALRPRARLDAAEREDAAPADLFPSALDVEGTTAERDQIERILRALPERPRAALLLAAVQGFTTEEIAEALGVSAENARQILSRARAQFRRRYDEAQRPRE